MAGFFLVAFRLHILNGGWICGRICGGVDLTYLHGSKQASKEDRVLISH
jgi:hypothetical protein